MPERISTAPQVAIFDVCNTLYCANTTAGFIRFVHRLQRNQWRRLLALLVCHRASPLRYALILLSKVCRHDISRKLLIRTLRGIGQMELEELAQRYVREELKDRRIQPIHAELEHRRKQGATIYLASSSLDVVIAAVTTALQANGFVASELGFVTRRCTGTLHSDVTGAKVQALQVLWTPSPQESVFVCSDNASDAALFALAQEKMVVVKGGHIPPQLNFQDATYVQLS